MMSLKLAIAAFTIMLSTSFPALARSSAAVPESSTLMLFGLGLMGLIIGRRGGRPRRD